MRAMAVVSYAEPLVEIELPEPELGPGNALVEVLTCGVCFSDVKTSRGLMPFSDSLALPHVPGHEICARVLATDPEGALEPGTVVLAYHYWPCGRCSRCRAGEETLCLHLRAWMGFTDPGGFQERLVIPLDRLFPLPPGIDPIQAAPVTCAIGTAYRATVTRAAPAAGSTIGIIGLGGVGIHALQIASAIGARAIGIDPSDRARAVASSLELSTAASGDEAREAVRELTDGEGLDAVVVTAGASGAYADAGALVRKGGRIVGVGYAPPAQLVLATARFVLDEIELLGSRYTSRGELDHAIAMVAEGRIRPIVDMVRPLQDVNEVYAALDAGEIVGRGVLTVGLPTPEASTGSLITLESDQDAQ
jgi:D-arabinose 1-dehydrogenase-like Zn-dependent alcohol dehydrogenase